MGKRLHRWRTLCSSSEAFYSGHGQVLFPDFKGNTGSRQVCKNLWSKLVVNFLNSLFQSWKKFNCYHPPDRIFLPLPCPSLCSAPALQRAAGRSVRASWVWGPLLHLVHWYICPARLLGGGGSVRPHLQWMVRPVLPGLVMQHPWQGQLGSHCCFLEGWDPPVRYSLAVPAPLAALWLHQDTRTPSLPRISLRHLGWLCWCSCFSSFALHLWKHTVTLFSANPPRTWSQSSELTLNASYTYWLIVNLSGTYFNLMDAVF